MSRFHTLNDYLKNAHYISGDLIRRIMEENNWLKHSLSNKYYLSDEFRLIVKELDCIWYQYPDFPTRTNCSLAFTGSTALTISNDWIKHLFRIIIDNNLSAPSANNDDIIFQFKIILNENTRKTLREKRINIFNTTVYGYNWMVNSRVEKKPTKIQEYLGWLGFWKDGEIERSERITNKADAFNAYPLLTYILEERNRAKIADSQLIEQAIVNKTSLSSAIKEEFHLAGWMIKKLNVLTLSHFSLGVKPVSVQVVEDFLSQLLRDDDEEDYNTLYKNNNIGILSSLNLANMLKPESCPKTAEEWQCFRSSILALQRLYLSLSYPDQRMVNVLQSIGEWNSDNLAKISKLDLDDIENDFFNNLIYPIVLLLDKKEAAAGNLVKQILWLDKTFAQILETSKTWHAEQRQVRNRLSSKFPLDKNLVQTWPPLVEKWTSSNGYTISSLCSRAELTHEGEDMAHCVGGYADNCIWDQKHILSIKSSEGDFRSTAELVDNIDTIQYKSDSIPKLSVLQHRGFRNSTPNQALNFALDELLQEISENKVKIDTSAIAQHRKHTRSRVRATEAKHRIHASYYCSDNWEALEEAWKEYSKLLGKPFKTMSLAKFCEHMEKMLIC